MIRPTRGNNPDATPDGDALRESVSSLVGCTITARERLPQAEVLAESFLRFNAGSRFAILVVDARVLEENFATRVQLLGLDDIGLSKEDEHRLPRVYGAAELCIATLPWLLRHLLSVGAKEVVYIAPETEVFAQLQLQDGDRNPVIFPGPTERPSGAVQIIHLSSDPDPLLEQWMTQLRHAFDESRALDLSWDCVPAETLPVRVLRKSTAHVGYWNLSERVANWRSGHLEVDQHPVSSFHFVGYEFDKPHWLSKHLAPQGAVLLSQSAALRRVCDEYRAKVCAAELRQRERFPMGLGFLPSGMKIDRYMRQLYRQALGRCERGQGPKPPDPRQDEKEGAFLKWLNQRVTDGKPEITRYMLAIHAARPDLQVAFPEPLGQHGASFYFWFMNVGRIEEQTPLQLVPDAADLVGAAVTEKGIASRDVPASVVNVVGYFRAELGIGEAARLLVTALQAADVPCSTASYGATSNRQAQTFEEQTAGAVGADIDIICVNADQLPAYAAQHRSDSAKRRYTIGFWFWEVDEFPESLWGAFDLVDEIWVATNFVRDALLKVSPKPVWKIDLPIVQPEVDVSLTRAHLGMPDGFTFVFSFDFHSVLERKNPVGLIQAFREAFQPSDGAALVIKTINGNERILEMEKLKYAAADRADIVLLDGYMLAREKNAMTALCDCYVSLHRSEGYGLTMAEAMALGKPVIGTDYSGNLDFMDAENSYLCAGTLTRVGPSREPYPAYAHWAEPDIAHATRLLRQVREQTAEANARGRRAAQDVVQLHSPAKAGASMRHRLERIRHRLALPEGERQAAFLRERLEFLQASQRAIVPTLEAQGGECSAGL